MNLNSFIRNIPDFPIPGIIFRDITPLLADGKAFDFAMDKLLEPFANANVRKVVAIESRGFIFGAAAASKLGVGFVPIRKKGKLPFGTDSETYSLEYGEAVIEIHKDALSEGEHILLMDDVLATGGTMAAACRLVERQKAVICGLSFLCELDALNGRKLLTDKFPIHSVLHF